MGHFDITCANDVVCYIHYSLYSPQRAGEAEYRRNSTLLPRRIVATCGLCASCLAKKARTHIQNKCQFAHRIANSLEVSQKTLAQNAFSPAMIHCIFLFYLNWLLHSEPSSEQRALKKRIILHKLRLPLAFIASTPADFDLITDWVFVGAELNGWSGLRIAAFCFSVIGSIMWASVAFEVPLVAQIWRKALKKHIDQRMPAGVLLLANMIVEDVPQLIITAIDSMQKGKLNALAAINFAGSGSWHEVQTRAELNMVEQAAAAMEIVLDKRDDAHDAARAAARLTDLVFKAKRSAEASGHGVEHMMDTALLYKYTQVPQVATTTMIREKWTGPITYPELELIEIASE
jgi:hypothetical protein